MVGMAMKRPRLIWTRQLHERFVEAVNKMGVDQAVPKAIMQSMNVKGITRENVASHLQKCRAQPRQMERQEQRWQWKKLQRMLDVDRQRPRPP